MEVHPLNSYNEQLTLASALSSRDIDSFRVNSPTELEKTEVETSMTIFERACQTPGCGKFIEKCLLAGCDVNKLNPKLNKRPINFAVESHSIENLIALLKDPNIDINSPCPMSNTPINTLTEQITDVNFRNVFPCIGLLVEQCADINLPNRHGMTPIMNILKNRNLNLENKKTLIKFILHNAIDIDLDAETRASIEEALPYFDIDKELDNVNYTNDDNLIIAPTNKLWNFNRLYHALKNQKENEFLTGIDHIAKSSPEIMNVLFTASEQHETLLIAAVSKDLTDATQRLIDLGADVNYAIKTDDDSESALKRAVARGHWKCLAALIKSPNLDLNAAPSLPIVVRNLGHKFTKDAPDANFKNCFEILMKQQNIDVNQYDSANCTALHYSVQCGNTQVTLELLKKGAYIGMQNKKGHLAISDIDAKVLKKHLDSCITTNGLRPSDEDFEIEFNYKNFIHQNNRKEKKELSFKNFIQEMSLMGRKDPKDECIVNQMATIAYMSKSADLKEVIMHPVIVSYANLRWRRLSVYFYVNFILCALWAILTIAYILIYYNDRYSDPTAYIFIALIFLLTSYIIGREIGQFIFSPRIYLTSVDNYIECTLVVLVMLILFDMYSDEVRRTFAATTILLFAVEFFLICGSLPLWSFSSYYVMLITVAFSFLKSLALYSIILIAFSLAFYTLLHDPPKLNDPNEENQQNGSDTNKVDDDDDDDDDDPDFNNFPSIGLSIVKTFVMAAGEFDAADIRFGVNSFSTIVFIIFVLLVSIVLLNLLTGLAVSDTAILKEEAEQTDFIRHVQVLALYDTAINKKWFRMMNRRSEKFSGLTTIRVRPNSFNLMLKPEHDSAYHKSNEICCHSRSLQSHMEPKVVRAARQVVEENAANEEDDCGVEELKERITKMEKMLKIIAEKLTELVKRYE